MSSLIRDALCHELRKHRKLPHIPKITFIKSLSELMMSRSSDFSKRLYHKPHSLFLLFIIRNQPADLPVHLQ
jgi:hypothetical protein